VIATMAGEVSSVVQDQPAVRFSAAEDIAIIGMACVFPESDGTAAFWANILRKFNAIGEPTEGWEAARYLHAGAISTAAGGFLKQLFRFDPADLGVMPNSIDGSEPDQFLALRVAREALADAGYLRDDVDHTTTGIILGHSTYLHRGNANVVQHGIVIDQTVTLLRQLIPALDGEMAAQIGQALRAHLPPFNADIAPGLVPNVMTGRIANRLNLRGPNYILDAACASSLLAVAAAVEELRAHRSDMMLAGSVNASLPAEVYMVFQQLGALSRSSRVRPFDADADGTLLGEGLGMVVLKRLSDARRDGDRVYALIKAVGQSSDGKGLGLLAPNPAGEELAIRRAYAQSGVAPAEIGLIEAHGTGIPLGDRTEIAALRAVFGARDGLPRCAVGSIKSMIGHCIPAAGIAGLIKTALALYYRVLPPTLCEQVNPSLAIEQTPLYVNSEARPWIAVPGQPRMAAVNAFGFGGINSHAILAEADAADPPVRPPMWPAELAVFAADTPAALSAALTAVVHAEADGRLAHTPLAPLCLGLAERSQKAGGPFRAAIVATDAADLAAKAAKVAARLREDSDKRYQARAGAYYAPQPLGGRLAFVFPGEGAQYQGMLGELLMCFPEARAWFDFWDGVFSPPGDGGVRRSDCVFPPPTTLDDGTRAHLQGRLFGLEVGSEAMFIASQAMLAVLTALGCTPDAVVGHSSGENSALLAGGAFRCGEWGELAHHIRTLNQLYNDIERAEPTEGGALLTVGAVARERILALVDDADVFLALDNCHHQSVLYGARPVMERLARQLGGEGGLCAFLPFDRPYHTPLFATTAGIIAHTYDELGFRSPTVPIYSCTTAAPMPAEPAELRRLALAQWSSRVRFTETIERMYADGYRTFVEVGPSSNLTGFIEDILRGRPALAVALDNQRRPGLAAFLNGLARLWANGGAFDVTALFARRGLSPLDVADPAASRARQRAYPNTLPVVRLSEGEVAPLRALVAAALAPATDRAGAMVVPPVAPCADAAPVAAAPEGEAAPAAAGLTAAPAPQAPEIATKPGEDDLAALWHAHFGLMQAFLTSQERVLTQALAGPGGADADEGELPFVHRLLEETADRVVAACELSVDQHPFLLHHVLYTTEVSDLDPALHGLAVVPLSVSLEMAAEVAALIKRQPTLVRLEDVQAHDWIALDDGARTLTLIAERRQADAGEDRILAVIRDGEVPLFQATAVFAAAAPRLTPTLPPLALPRPPVWRDDQLYTSGMFHGPMFQSVAHLSQWDETGLDVTLHDTPLDGFLAEGERPRLLLNPVLLDAIGHVTAFWIAQHMGTDFSSFPSRIGRIDLAEAACEETAGAVLGGRMAFVGASRGEAGYLAGDYECLAADGRVLFRATGWQDRFFSVPPRFFFARFRPRDGWYGEDISALFPALPPEATVWRVPAFPPRFLTDSGGIWWRVLAHTVLSRTERAALATLPTNGKRRVDWLMGRLALKEVVRYWLARVQGVLLLPADIEIATDALGKPYVVEAGLESFAPLPEVSVAHAEGAAVAIAAPPEITVGIDFEPLGRVIHDDLLRGAFSPEEQRLLSGGDGTAVLRAWCAKEAAAKCLGEGLNGRPQAFRLSRFAAGEATMPAAVHASGYDIGVAFAHLDGAVLAVAASDWEG
jgi:acyl transferase domain-containing protein/phosphopantetheinyl transferase